MLQLLLEKLGITNYESLTAEEKKTYETWGEILTSHDVTLDDVRKLAASESERAHAEIKKFENSKERQLFFQALARLTDTFKLFIDTPAAQRDTLRAHLKQTFKVEI